MKIARFVGVGIGLLALAWFLTYSPRQELMDKDILIRSQDYIRTYSNQPFIDLSREQKLLLLHSYSNIADHGAVIRIAEEMMMDLKRLPDQRRKPFIQMIEEAYLKLGKSEKMLVFRRKFNSP